MSKLELESSPLFTSYPFTRPLGTKYAARPEAADEAVEEFAEEEWSAAKLLSTIPPAPLPPARPS